MIKIMLMIVIVIMIMIVIVTVSSIKSLIVYIYTIVINHRVQYLTYNFYRPYRPRPY